MRLLLKPLLVFLFLITGAGLFAQGLLPDVQEQKLKNGVRILLVERPGTGAVHVRLFLRGGRADTEPLSPAAADLLCQCLFNAPIDGESRNSKELEALLKSEEGSFESLRVEHLRRERNAPEEPSQSIQDLEALHAEPFHRIQGLVEHADQHPPLDEMGAVSAKSRTEADFITCGADLPQEKCESFLSYLAERLKNPMLARFPWERAQFLEGLSRKDGRDRKTLDTFVSSALFGQPYAQAYSVQKASLEALTWSELRNYARGATDPGRILVVLVGDIKMPQILASMDRTFGGLTAGSRNRSRMDEIQTALPEAAGPRRLQASIVGENQLLVGWRVPPLSHPDYPTLQVLAQILGGDGGRLPMRLRGDHPLVSNLSVNLAIPGGRAVNLLMIEATPSEGHSLAEIEQAMQGELIHLQRGLFQEGEIRKAQRQVEVDQLRIQEDAADLANVLGTAVCQGGDWRLAFRSFQIKRDLTQQEMQAVALKYLSANQSTTALLEPDPLLLPQDPAEQRAVLLLTKILETKLNSPGQVEAIVRESLRQLRMLPPKEREQTLKLLESQVKP